MDTGKERSSLKGSKTNVAESNVPLLEDPNAGEGTGSPQKERVELESAIEKEDAEREKSSGEGETERRRPRALTCMESFTVSMNLLDRDSAHINDHVNVVFEDVLAEPRANQGFDQVWQLAYVLFSGTKFWVYRVLAAACAVPCGVVWGLFFSLLSVASVWIITPTMKVIDVLLHIVRRVWTGVIHAILDPVFQSVSLCFGGINIRKQSSTQEIP